MTRLTLAGFIVCVLLIFQARCTLQKGQPDLSIKDFSEVFTDLSNHSSFQYLNYSVLTENYFEEALQTMNDEAVYIILSDTRTASSRIISLFTENEYNHISLSFDFGLKTTISYNGGNKRYPPGMNPELIADLVSAENASALIYRLRVDRAQKMEILNKVRKINNEGSSYNILGLIFNRSFKPNIMYCSQFVYNILNESGAHYFSAENDKIKPSDFIELDYKRRLEFCYEL